MGFHAARGEQKCWKQDSVPCFHNDHDDRAAAKLSLTGAHVGNNCSKGERSMSYTVRNKELHVVCAESDKTLWQL